MITGKFVTLLTGLYFYRQLSIPLRLILLQTAVALFCECVGKYFAMRQQNNLWLFNYYMIVDFVLMGTAAMYFFEKRKTKIILAGIMTALTIIWLINIYKTGIYTLANTFFLLDCIFLAVVYFIILFRTTLFKGVPLLKTPLFWLCGSVVLYYTGIVPYKAIENTLIASSVKLAAKLFMINQVLNIIRYPLVGITFYLVGSKSKVAHTNA